MEVDDDIFVVKDSKPKEPLEDPLALMIVSDIINLDSSDEELPICKLNQMVSGKSYNSKATNEIGSSKKSIDLDSEVSQKIHNSKVVKKHKVYDHSNATTPVLNSVCTLNDANEPIAFIIPKPSVSIQNSLQPKETHNSCAIDKSFRQKCILTAEKTSQQKSVKSSGKQNNLVRFKSKMITEPTIAIGKKARNTVMDLNLNVNEYEKRSAITDRLNKIQQSLRSPCDSSSQYNVALGLVLNVNNSDQSGDSCRFTTAKMSRINDVALDVSVNVNNQEKPTEASGQVVQNMQLHTPSLKLDSNIPNLFRKWYSCLKCSFQTTKIDYMNTHNCFGRPQSEQLVKVHKQKKIPVGSSNIVFQSKQNVYECKICKIINPDFQVMKLHICPPKCPPSLSKNSKQIKNIGQAGSLELPINEPPKLLSCVSCSFQTTDLEAIKSHNCLLLSNVNIQGDLIKQIYCCSVCSFQTSDLESVKSHTCTSPKVPEKSAEATTPKNIESLVQDGSESSKNNIQKKLQTRQSCGAYSCQTKCMCSSQHRNKLPNFDQKNLKQRKNFTVSKNMYCCVSCSFKTSNFNVVNSHRCREYLSKSPPSSPPIIPEDITCPICVRKFHDKYVLFQHLRYTHLKFIRSRRLRCHYCDMFIIDSEFVKHLKEIHKSKSAVLPSERVEGYECQHCKGFIYDPENVAAHLNAHLLFLFDRVALLKILASTGAISLYSCILCGNNTPNIGALLSHCCKPISNISSIIDEHNTIPGTIPKKYTRTSEVSCYSCKRKIYNRQLLQCECENVYHISCVNIYATLLPHDEVNNMPNWFCLECNNDNVKHLLTARDDVDTVDWCLDFAHKEYLQEARKQEILAKEITKINEETEKMKKEFEQIKTFIFRSKSEKINNKLVRSVCNIIDSYISAGCD